MGTVHHVERLVLVDVRLHRLVEAWALELDFDFEVIEGLRSFAQARANWAKGRELRVVNDANADEPWAQHHLLGEGVWVVVDPKQVVTYAEHPEQSPHTHGGAIDAMPLVNKDVIWDEKSPEWPLVRERLQRMQDLAKRCSIVCGADFTHPDLDHFEVPDWKALPLVST